ncbi:MAG: small acid-soluble spore protein SspI [Bacilli bacterium]
MDLSIREHIINNFKEDDINTLKNAIEESIAEKDEVTLPGMGVFFEIVWSDATDNMKQEILNIIKARLEKEK